MKNNYMKKMWINQRITNEFAVYKNDTKNKAYSLSPGLHKLSPVGVNTVSSFKT